MKAMRWSVLVVCAALLCACNEESSSADNANPCNGKCGEQEYCIKVEADDVHDGLKAGDEFCSKCKKDCAADKKHPICVEELGVCGATDTCEKRESLKVEGGFAVCKKGSGDDIEEDGDDYTLDISENAVTVKCSESKEVTVTYLKGKEKVKDASLELASSDENCVSVGDHVSTDDKGTGTIELKAKEPGKDCTAQITVSAKGVEDQKIKVTVEGKGCESDEGVCETNKDCLDGEYCIEAKYEVAGDDVIKVGDKFCSACPIDCDPDSQYPVCVSSIHVCAAVQTCPSDQQFLVNGMTATCVSTNVENCSADEDCKNGYVCDKSQEICVPDKVGDKEVYRYVRIDDVSDACTKDEDGKCHADDPGADIDAVVLIKPDGNMFYAAKVAGYMRSDGLLAGERYDPQTPVATDPQKAVGKPDSFVNYPNADAKCAYYLDDAKTEHPYVSLGGKNGFVALEMAEAIEAGDKIDVLEVGACSENGGKPETKAEPIKLQISVSQDKGWKVIGESITDGTNKGILSFTVAQKLLN